MALILRNGGSQSPDRWLKEPRNNHQIEQNGTNAKIEVFKGLSHGFGLGERTVAEGWIDHAISFWEDNMNASDER